MRRTELERRLTALGWRNTGRETGIGRLIWAHPKIGRVLAVLQTDLLMDATAQALLDQAGEE
jgi:hypothetical protein